MRTGRFTTRLGISLLGACIAASLAWSADSAKQAPTLQHHRPPQHDDRLGDFVKIVRDVTRRYRDIRNAQADGYVEQFGCVSGSDQGAMGVHLVHGALVGDPALDVAKPELLVYEPGPNGRMQLVAADYLVLKDAWDANNPAPPELMGQLFHLFEAPNRFGLPAFYTLHVWAWKDNPHGTFVNWHPQVSCDQFEDQGQ
jgi:hypothetical protein